MPDFSAPDGIQLKLFSPTDELLGILSDTDRSGPILAAQVKVLKVGGVDKFSFRISRDVDIPITRNSTARFYVRGDLWFAGYIQEIPQADQENPILIVEGEGFYKRLLKKTINDDYVAEPLIAIVQDVANTYLGADVGVFYNIDKIDVPALVDLTIEFKDKTLLSVFTTLLSICNYDYLNTKYRFYVDNDRELVFEQLDESVPANVFEGYQYQSPEVSQDTSKMINRILTFRTEALDPDVVEFVAAYEDSNSQARYGTHEKKITFPDFVDTVTIANIANAILEQKALPKDKLAIKDYELSSSLIVRDNLIVDSSGAVKLLLVDMNGQQDVPLIVDSKINTVPLPFAFGNYSLSNRKEDYWRIIADCDILTGWDVSGLDNTVLTLSATHVLTGKQSMKFVTGAGSSGEYVTYILAEPIAFPRTARVYIYFEDPASILKVTFWDNVQNKVEIDFNESKLINQWVELSRSFIQETEVVDLDIDMLITDSIFGVTYDIGMFIAVGAENKVYISVDGITWTAKDGAHDTRVIWDVVYGERLFVAVGAWNKISTSPNGIGWAARTGAHVPDHVIYGIAYADNVFVAVGYLGEVSTSPNGINWTLRTGAHGTNTIHDIVYGSELFVAVGDIGKVSTSPNGIDWTLRTGAHGESAIYAVTYGTNLFVAGGSAAKISTSPDGINWTARTAAPGMPTIQGMACRIGDEYHAELFVAVGDIGKISTSPNGIDWTLRTGAHGTSDIRSVTYGEGLFVAVGHDAKISTSPNGIDWTLREIIYTMNMLIDPNGNTEDFLIRHETFPGLQNIARLRIDILTDAVTTFYLDRLDTLASIYSHRKLQLEEAIYNLSSVGMFADLNFGEKEDSVIDEIKENVKEGNLALAVFSKQ